MENSLDERIRRQLKDCKGDWKAIAVGSGVSYSWLSKFVNGHIDNPGYGTLRKLAEFLDGTVSQPARKDEPAEAPAANDDDPYIGRQEATVKRLKQATNPDRRRDGPGARDERFIRGGHPGSVNRERHPE